MADGPWSPIETCPKDGTEFLAAGQRREGSESWWECNILAVDASGEVSEDYALDGGLQDYSHWLPLPPEPAN